VKAGSPDGIGAQHARRSVRGFLPPRVERATVEAILTDASRSPSASNARPWQVYACQAVHAQRGGNLAAE
jgi:nitroreductase